MSLMEWSKDLELDVIKMDDQHKVLLELMNRLYDDYRAGSNFMILNSTFEELGNMTIQHFKEEEEYMDSINFPGRETHKVIHKDLLEKFAVHKEAFIQDKELTDDFFVFLKFWLRSHIMGIDTKYASHVHSNAA